MIKRAKVADAEALATLAIQMWTELDSEEMEEENGKLYKGIWS